MIYSTDLYANLHESIIQLFAYGKCEFLHVPKYSLQPDSVISLSEKKSESVQLSNSTADALL